MKKLLLIVNILIFQLALVFAGTTGKLTGVITDAVTGDPLPFVNITFDGTVIGGSTDLDGKYVILNIPPGKYNVKIQYIGYQTKVFENIVISIDLTTKLDAELSESSVELGEIVVQAQADVIKKDITSSQASISADDIENLPVQEFDDVLQLQAGVTRDANNDFHIRGGRNTEIAYQVNGISITDSYDNSRGIEIDNSTVQELQVISGTFNAEYGNAMSGIVNTVTKEGGDRIHGEVQAWTGDYVSNHTDIFTNVQSTEPSANHNIQASLSGPVPGTSSKVRYFLNGRYFYDDGYLYGIRNFTPSGDSGDGSYVPMNWRERVSGIANLSWTAGAGIKINLEGLYSDMSYKDYGHDYKWNPDGDVTKYTTSYTGTFTLSHAISSSTFYTLKGSYFNKDFHEYLYENWNDSRYLHPDSLISVDYAFHDGGTNLHRFYRETNTLLVKLDFTSQVHENHLLKLGSEFKTHKLDFDSYDLQPKTDDGVAVEPFEPQIPAVDDQNRDLYTKKPIEFSAYIQDKIEFEEVIVNIGLRFDYFDAKGNVIVNPKDPNIYAPLRTEMRDLTIEERKPYYYKDSEAKSQISPRLGIAYPVSDNGVLHFSYGQFLQIPTFQYLYDRGNYKVPNSGTFYGPMGNPDLKPERRAMYELGIRQEFGGDYLMDVTMFYSDVRDYVTAGAMIETLNSVAYSVYTNRDYANVRGVTLTFNKRFSNYFSFNLNYTYQVAEGSNSTPEDDYNAQTNGDEPTLYLLPLNWDQRHILNASIYTGYEGWGASLLARYGSGLPYTPSITQAVADSRGLTSGFDRNSRRRPNQFTLDLKLEKSIDLTGGLGLNFFLNVYNLLDTKIVTEVFTDTGVADYTTEGKNVGEDENRPNTIAEYLTRPWYYASPREIQFGFNFTF